MMGLYDMKFVIHGEAQIEADSEVGAHLQLAEIINHAYLSSTNDRFEITECVEVAP